MSVSLASAPMTHRRWIAVVVALGAWLSVTTSLPSATAARPLAGFDEFVQSVMKEYHTPGVAVAIIQNDKLLLCRGYGTRAIGKNEPVDEHSLFMIASCTKSFTAAALGTLVDEKKLTWDTPIADLLPGYRLKDPYATRHATARDFLAHRSGLPPFGADLFDKLGYDRSEVLRRLRYLEPACSFRERAGYSNPGYFIAGMLAAHLAGGSYDDVVRTRLLQPLGMNHTSTRHSEALKVSNRAQAHFPGPNGPRIVPWEDHDGLGPAGCINSTAADMARWVRMLLNEGQIDGKRVLQAETVRAMFEPAMISPLTLAELAPIDEHSGFAFTMGWGNFHYQGYEIIEKGGARAGMRACVVLVPAKRFGVVVLANMNLTVAPEAIRAWLLERFVAPAGQDLQKGIRAGAERIRIMFEEAASELPKRDGQPTRPLPAYTGVFTNDLYGPVTVKLVAGGLRWEAGPARFGGTLEHASYDTFILGYPDGLNSLPEPITFTIGPSGRAVSLECHTLGRMRVMTEKP
jgi:CubicO group peptidase (beta-lactamase class C family)